MHYITTTAQTASSKLITTVSPEMGVSSAYVCIHQDLFLMNTNFWVESGMHCFCVCVCVSFIHLPAGLHRMHRAALVSPVRFIWPHVISNSSSSQKNHSSFRTLLCSHLSTILPVSCPRFSSLYLSFSHSQMWHDVKFELSIYLSPTHTYACKQMEVNTALQKYHSSLRLSDSGLKDENFLAGLSLSSIHFLTQTLSQTRSSSFYLNTNWICGLDRTGGQGGRIKITSLRTPLRIHIPSHKHLHTHIQKSTNTHGSFACIRDGNGKSLNPG